MVTEALEKYPEYLRSVYLLKNVKLLSLASEAGDEATVALMSDYLKEQEKLVWMLVAYSTCDCKK